MRTAAIRTWQHSANPNDPRLGKAYWTLGIVEVHRGHQDTARGHLAEALRLLRLGLGEDHPWVQAVKRDLASGLVQD